ncbi:MAG: helix-turn-helix transcriptional regulator [Pirellulales bacterium]|nr:helix-turn-helix transcriptional regulator [Pirellulales bacterium]
MATTKNLAEAIRRKLASDKDLAADVDRERLNMSVGSAIFEARAQAGLTQRELADRVDMQQSAIARLESADYDGYTLKTLERIAVAVGKRIEVAFVDQSVGKQDQMITTTRVHVSRWESPPPSWTPTITTTPYICGTTHQARQSGAAVA